MTDPEKISHQAAQAAPKSLDELAYAGLRSALVKGAFAPGERLSIRRISDALQVGQMPARNAVRRLAAEKALDLTPAGTAVVPRMTKDAFAELGAIRAELEPLALRLAAPRLLKRDFKQLDEKIAQHKTALASSDPEKAMRTDQEFLFTIYGACNAPFLLQILETAWLRRGPMFWEARWLLLNPTGVQTFYDPITNGLRDGNVDVAARALKSGIERTTAFLIANHQFADGEAVRPSVDRVSGAPAK